MRYLPLCLATWATLFLLAGTLAWLIAHNPLLALLLAVAVVVATLAAVLHLS